MKKEEHLQRQARHSSHMLRHAWTHCEMQDFLRTKVSLMRMSSTIISSVILYWSWHTWQEPQYIVCVTVTKCVLSICPCRDELNFTQCKKRTTVRLLSVWPCLMHHISYQSCQACFRACPRRSPVTSHEKVLPFHTVISARIGNRQLHQLAYTGMSKCTLSLHSIVSQTFTLDQLYQACDEKTILSAHFSQKHQIAQPVVHAF